GGFVAQRREHQHRHDRSCPDLPQYVVSVHSWKRDIQNNCEMITLENLPKAFRPVVDHIDAVSLRFKKIPQQTARLRVSVNNEQTVRCHCFKGNTVLYE